MIERLNQKEDIKEPDFPDLFYIRIMSLMKAYGFSYDFSSYYKQVNEDNKVTALISKLDGDFTLCCFEGADREELCEFFSVMGYSSVLSDDSFKMPSPFCEGIIMKSNKKTEITIPYTVIDRYPKLMELFNFIDYESTDFEAWYVDVSHRIRHGCAMAYTLNVNGEIISSAIFSAIYRDNAVLSSVQTAPAFRRMGYGSALISEMSADIKGNIFLMREKTLNEEFYKKLGFINIGKWRTYR